MDNTMYSKRNLLSREDALQRVLHESFERQTVSFYRYVRIEDPFALRDQLFDEWSALGVLGRTYLSHEGINAQISVPLPQWDAFIANLESRDILQAMPLKVAVEERGNPSFIKNTIKVRPYIVADGLPDGTYDITNVGQHLNAEEWNQAMEDPNTIVVDMRNGYESRIGHFKGALTPDVDTFREELPLVLEQLQGKEDKKILLYCTGGVRCEKTSAYLKHHGFDDVNQLYGGIIAYKHEIDEKGLDNKFVGKNFVFDGRVEETISDEVIATCDICSTPADDMVNCSNVACNLLFIECPRCANLLEGACSMECYRIMQLPEDKQKELRKAAGANQRNYTERLRKDLKPLTKLEQAQLMLRAWMKKLTQREAAEDQLPGKYIGKVSHYYRKAQVVEFILEGQTLQTGDALVFRGETTDDVRVTITELRVDGVPAEHAQPGDVVTVHSTEYLRKNDIIYKEL